METIEQFKRREDVPVVVSDDQGVLVHVNRSFEEIFGWTSQESLGQPMIMIIPPYLRDAHHMGFSRFLSTQKPTLMAKPLTLKAINKKGQEFDAEHFIIAEKIQGRWQFAATIKPLN